VALAPQMPTRKTKEHDGLIDLTWGGVFAAGLLSFVSPCVLPLVPPYLCYLAGVTLDQLSDGERDIAVTRRVVFSAAAFVAGFSTVFVVLGATASVLGQLLLAYSDKLAMVAGVVIIVMGLHFLGVFRIGLLYREARVAVNSQPAGLIGAYVMGLAFAFGWTPCIGPVLAAILPIAGAEETVLRGAGLLGVYALGIGVPFLAAAAFAGPFLRWAAGFRRHMGTVEKTMGGLLVATGILFLTGQITIFSYWLLETFPAFSSIG